MTKPKKPDRRIRRTRRQLSRALYALIKEIPYSEITISKIVDEADISRATYYLHFKDKNELLIGSLNSLLADAIQTFTETQPFSENVVSDLKSLAHFTFNHVQDNKQIYKALHNDDIIAFGISHLLPPLVGLIQHHIQHVNDEEAHQLVGALYGLVLWWLNNDLQPSTEEMVNTFYEGSVSNVYSDAL